MLRFLASVGVPCGAGVGRPQFSVFVSRKIAESAMATKRTYQPSKVKRARTHGFLVRMRSRGGRAVIAARRAKGRQRLGI